jgi:methylase of polypeptide subunit release factors
VWRRLAFARAHFHPRGKAYVHSSYPTVGADAVFFGPDTVRFVDAIERHLDAIRPVLRRAADIGCGAGPGGICIAARAPSASVAMIDINDAALRFARINARLNGAPNAVAHKSDILKQVGGDFDLIVSNPPYLIDSLGRAYRHGGGRLGEGLSVAILHEALDRLAPGGSLILYSGVAIVGGLDSLKAICASHMLDRPFEWSYREADPDVFGEELEGGRYAEADRIAAVVLTARRRKDG